MLMRRLLLPARWLLLILLASAGVAVWAIETAGPQPAPTQTLPLWPAAAPLGDGKTEAPSGTLSVFLPPAERGNGAAMVICPGGGYRALVKGPEGSGIAAWLNEHGIAGIVLEYRLPAGRSFVPLLDVQRALRTVRSQAGAWKIDPRRIGIIGFSAGGHVASSAATHFDEGDPKASDPIDRLSCRPDFAVLVYPVITMGDKTHAGSKKNLLGASADKKLVDLFSNETQVSDRTPPTFLAHAVNDKAVPPENSRMFYQALKAHGVPAEYLELPEGGHGLNGYSGPMWAAWQQKSLAWLAERGVIPKPDVQPAQDVRPMAERK
jgi:acetyl esterase/lipase